MKKPPEMFSFQYGGLQLSFQVTGKKPPLVAFNMMIDAFGKQGLHEEALQYYVRLCDSGLQPNAVSYCSIISAMVKAGKFKKAEDIYNKMLAKGVKPNLHVYATMIHCYTKCKLIARGHEVSISAV
jgi:pentatricopeptide repeat protein